MVRETDHSRGMSLSSIALLQERFRQLQKIRELRQEKLLKTLSKSERYNPPAMIPVERRSTMFSGHEQMFAPPPGQHCQLSLSLWPDSQTKHADSREIKAPSILAKSFFADSTRQLVCTSSSFNIECSDVDIDTSLRL